MLKYHCSDKFLCDISVSVLLLENILKEVTIYTKAFVLYSVADSDTI